jgi:hypothetical protein
MRCHERSLFPKWNGQKGWEELDIYLRKVLCSNREISLCEKK